MTVNIKNWGTEQSRNLTGEMGSSIDVCTDWGGSRNLPLALKTVKCIIRQLKSQQIERFLPPTAPLQWLTGTKMSENPATMSVRVPKVRDTPRKQGWAKRVAQRRFVSFVINPSHYGNISTTTWPCGRGRYETVPWHKHVFMATAWMNEWMNERRCFFKARLWFLQEIRFFGAIFFWTCWTSTWLNSEDLLVVARELDPAVCPAGPARYRHRMSEYIRYDLKTLSKSSNSCELTGLFGVEETDITNHPVLQTIVTPLATH